MIEVQMLRSCWTISVLCWCLVGFALTQHTSNEVTLESWHVPMIMDTNRNQAYHKAIKRLVNSDTDLVLDIGTGSGLLSMMASKAGAKKVETCELNSGLANVATQIIAKNNFTDAQITVHPKISYDLQVGPGKDLSKKADVLVSEIFDNCLLGEHHLLALEHAREHLIKPDAIIIPAEATIYLQAIQAFHGFGQSDLVEGFDLGLMRTFRPKDSIHLSFQCFTNVHLSEVLVVKEFDFYDPDSTKADEFALSFTVTKKGVLNALVMWWQLRFIGKNKLQPEEEEITLNSGPEYWRSPAWSQTMYTLTDEIFVDEGDVMELIVKQSQSDWQFVVNHVARIKEEL
eukprot:TRINITY_DN5094_c0_g1_i1.p1 TRINITY_DN5094_c0_g1~~TRINITY_DN5094_c0_g1_i1.p1  ORF type:complete len:343 (+),score=45.21 TRINITY_DN5094_c0_g1_i1:86-1114(+)